ncbi:MAG: carotenoid 1,2-hydratase [Chloroflexota bacterium]|nr:carotenoid 1,2-hydratase [Chloroflexota bacterium]
MAGSRGRTRLAASLAAVAMLLVACTNREVAGLPPAPTPTPVAYAPVTFPQDEAPHDDLSEWWYYTGHLEAEDGRRWGFQFVTFQALRGTLPPFYVAHFAVTDHQRGQFRYGEQATQGAQPQPADGGFSLDVDGWQMSGRLGQDHLAAALPEYAIDLRATTERPPVLHDGGLVTFGPAGDSYYYSRTRMDLTGTLVDHGEPVAVRGHAWFDKQWGNFLVMGGGWDWFSIQLEDGSDVMLNLIRDAQGVIRLAYGTYVAPDGRFRHLDASEFEVTPLETWTSPRSGATYPMGWRARARDPELDLVVRPVLLDQELDTRRTTNIIYWEGDQEVTGTLGGQSIRGQAYVELVGYAPSS